MIRTLFLFLMLSSFRWCAAANEKVTVQMLQGEWTRILLHQEDSCLPPEEYVPPLPRDNKWVVKDDSISLYNYPATFFGKHEFSIRGDSLFVSAAYQAPGMRWRKNFYALVHYESGELTLFMPECITMKFKRDTFDIATKRLIQVLNRDTLNPYLLVKKYTMKTHFVPDDAEAYDSYPPVKMKLIITIKDSTAARRLIHEQSITLSVDGKLQKFHVEYIEWHSWASWRTGEFHCAPEFVITPGSWWKGEQFRVHYQAKEAE